MSSLVQQNFSVRPGAVWQNSAVLATTEKVGKVSLRFHNLNGFDRLSTPVSQPTLLFRLAESDDMSSFTALHSAPIIVRSGAEDTVNVNMRKKFVRIQSKSGLEVPRAVTIEADDNKVTLAAHGYIVGDRLIFFNLAGGTGLTQGYEYFVKSVPSSSTFTLASAVGLTSASTDAVVDITVDYTGYVAKVGGSTGGFARCDAQHVGRLFQGQLEFLVWGKSGYGYDGAAPTTTNGVQDFTTGVWPEGAPS